MVLFVVAASKVVARRSVGRLLLLHDAELWEKIELVQVLSVKRRGC